MFVHVYTPQNKQVYECMYNVAYIIGMHSLEKEQQLTVLETQRHYITSQMIISV